MNSVNFVNLIQQTEEERLDDEVTTNPKIKTEVFVDPLLD